MTDFSSNMINTPSPQTMKRFSTFIANNNIESAYGTMNLDWFTSVGHASQSFPGKLVKDPMTLLFCGKQFWNGIATAPRWSWAKWRYIAQKELPEYGDFVPGSNIIAAAVVRDLIYNPRYTFEQIFPHSADSGSLTDVKSPPAFHQEYNGPSYASYNDSGQGAEGIAAQPYASPVGGVYLGGAGQLLDNIGAVSGVALDENDNLVLLSESGGSIDLPPLRLDDVVTVFRSVYLHGEGPTVTIDPNPDDPEGSAMIIRHGAATADTYVGWVLFEADRLMKGYTIGFDNNTTEEIVSSVPGYDDVRDRMYFGESTPEQTRRGGKWERFWIVPAASDRFEADDLSLFEVPLKVKTQVMKWSGGELVDDRSGSSSVGAASFVDWFTGNYADIAAERFLLPPPESGLTEPVPVFAELQRIALITAIAETLRDRGVVMPHWMRDYAVTRVPFERFTPALEVTRTQGTSEAHIYGGVQLSPETTAVRRFADPGDLADLEAPAQAHGAELLERSVALADAVESAGATEPLVVTRIDLARTSYRSFSVPGAASRDLMPCRLAETDLAMAVPGGREIALTRRYNSFFSPEDAWGEGWTMDLPTLDKILIPTDRSGDAVRYVEGREYVTPLNTGYVRFSSLRPIPALGGVQLMAPDEQGPFLALADGDPDFLNLATLEVIAADGSSLHFTQSGHLAAIDRSGFRTVYLRDETARIIRIVGLLGRSQYASIDLIYDEQGRLASARGESGEHERTVRYEYAPDGRLAWTTIDGVRRGYRYEDRRVAVILSDQDGSVTDLHRFEYDDRGRLTAEWTPQQGRFAYDVQPDGHGRTLTVAAGPDSRSVSYDAELRPVAAAYPDGSRTAWTYAPGDGTTVHFVDGDGDSLEFFESEDRAVRRYAGPGLPLIAERFDDAGRLVSYAVNDEPVETRSYHPDGRLRAVATDQRSVQPRYDEYGLVTGVIETPPDAGETLREWRETDLDREGRPTRITDATGLDVSIVYDLNGDVVQQVTERDGSHYGYTVERDEAGRPSGINSSWGNQRITYDSDGGLAETVTEVPGPEGPLQAIHRYRDGLLTRIEQFDGGVVDIEYDEAAKTRPLPVRIRSADGLELEYAYDEADRVREIRVGDRMIIDLSYDAQGRVVAYTSREAAGE